MLLGKEVSAVSAALGAAVDRLLIRAWIDTSHTQAHCAPIPVNWSAVLKVIPGGASCFVQFSVR